MAKDGKRPMINPNTEAKQSLEAKLVKLETSQSIEGNASSETGEEYRRICAELGLQPDFLAELLEIPPQSRHHRKLSDWIEIFIEDSTESKKKAVTIPSQKNCLVQSVSILQAKPLKP